MKTKILFTLLLLFMAVGVSAQNIKRFGIKSGIVKVTTSTMGIKNHSTMYFDNYGAQQMTETSVNLGVAKRTMREYTLDDAKISWNVKQNKAERTPVSGPVLNYSNLTDEVKEHYKVKELGTETILGRECTKYSVEMEENGLQIENTVWVWKGIPMKSEHIAGVKISMEVTELQENADIPDGIFDIPSNVSVKDVKKK